jgi:hypothetical protein
MNARWTGTDTTILETILYQKSGNFVAARDRVVIFHAMQLPNVLPKGRYGWHIESLLQRHGTCTPQQNGQRHCTCRIAQPKLILAQGGHEMRFHFVAATCAIGTRRCLVLRRHRQQEREELDRRANHFIFQCAIAHGQNQSTDNVSAQVSNGLGNKEPKALVGRRLALDLSHHDERKGNKGISHNQYSTRAWQHTVTFAYQRH